MTGTIKTLGAERGSGCIKAEGGLIVPFESAAVLAYDAISLAVGQLVSFELEHGSRLNAINVFVHRQHLARHFPENRHDSIRLRYMGFEQMADLRAYIFQRSSGGEEATTVIVTTDLALFAKHHVRIQDGPVLCLHLLMADLDAAGSALRPPLQRSLTDQDMLAHLSSLPAPRAKSRPKGLRRTPAATTHRS